MTGCVCGAASAFQKTARSTDPCSRDEGLPKANPAHPVSFSDDSPLPTNRTWCSPTLSSVPTPRLPRSTNAHVRRRPCGANSSTPALRAYPRATCETACSSGPHPMPSVFVHSAEQLAGGQFGCLEPVIQRDLTHPGIGIVRVSPALPFRSMDRPVFLTLLDVAKLQIHRLVSPNGIREENCEEARSRLPLSGWPSGACQRPRDCSGVNQLPARTPSFLTPLTRRMPAARSGLRRPQSAAS